MAANEPGKLKRAPDISNRPEPDFDLIEELANRAPVHPRPEPKPKKTKRATPNQWATSFFLKEEDKGRLKETLERVNAISDKKISEAVLVRALLYRASKTEAKSLLQAVREVVF